MSDFTTRALVWLTYRLGATIALGIPLVLLIWSGLRRDPALMRLLGIYWKVASLLAISVLLMPQAVKTHRYNRCVDAQIQMRDAINAQGQSSPGKLNYLKAIEHCEGR